MKRFFILFVLNILIFAFSGSSNVFAQSTGCRYNNAIYYSANGSSGGVPNYKATPNIASTSAFCVVNIGGTCRINKDKKKVGTLVTFYFVQCPIDDYVPVFVIMFGLFGFFTIRCGKKQLFRYEVSKVNR